MQDAWAAAQRILCIRLDSLGDVLMTTPAIRAVAEARQDRHITMLTSPAGAAAARLVPEIDDVIVYEAPWMKAGDPRPAACDLVLIDQLRGAHFDAAIIFTVFSQNPLPAAMLCHLAGIPLSLAHCRERAYRLLSDAVQETEPESGIRHEARRQLDLVAHLGWHPASEALSMQPPPEAKQAVAALITQLQLDTGPWAVLHPGASAPSRRYPPERYADAMRALARNHGWRFVLTGDASEATLIETVITTSGVQAHNLAGQLDLGELAALIGRAPLLISNNTGPAHIAAAMGTPVVDLYALTNAQHTPWGVPSRVLSFDVPCRWCYRSVCPEGHHLCLRGVTPVEIVEAALELVSSPVSIAA